ncbi:hypothetical protein POM88_031456 [Heracleum sosnowskyi]|uniref:Uncharacterized protein n=1 Tax=Heracleum sosnowskyi TaxID=360622 RepID=A0AAD8HYB0_9APIA|nr:hypothetical protein POM88_031456 [Heracleum sosnowskyi]
MCKSLFVVSLISANTSACRDIQRKNSVDGCFPFPYNRMDPRIIASEVSSVDTKHRLGVDFAGHYKLSTLYQRNKVLVEELSLQRRTTGRPAQTLAATHLEDEELT